MVVVATTRTTSPPDTRLDVHQPTGVRRGRRPGRWGRAVLWLPAVLMLCLGLVGLDRHSVWRDEAASLVAARRSLPDLWSMLGHVETVHALYYTLLHGWLLLGGGEAWARVPSVLAMAVAAGLVGVVGARLVSVPVGLVAGLLFAVNPSTSYYAQEARSTALVAACALLATWFLLRSLARGSTWWTAYAVTCTFLVGLNLLALLVPLAHATTLLCWRRQRRELRSWATASAPSLLVALVLVVAARNQPYQIGWIPKPGAGSIRDFAHLTLGPDVPVVLLVSLLAVVGVLASVPGSGVGSRGTAERRLVLLALPLATLPTVVLLAVSLVQPVFVARYVFPSVAAVALLAALGVVRLGRFLASRTGRPAVGLVAAATVLAVAAGGVATQRLERTAASRPDDLAGAAGVIASSAQPGDVVVFLPSNRRLVALAYPEAFARVHDVGLDGEPAQAGDLTGRPLPVSVTLQNLSASSRVWAVGRPGLTLLPSERDARVELALLDRDFVAVGEPGSHGVGIRLYVRRPRARTQAGTAR